MFRRLLSPFPKYTTYSSQYLIRSIDNSKTYGFKREIVPSDFEYEKSKEKPKK